MELNNTLGVNDTNLLAPAKWKNDLFVAYKVILTLLLIQIMFAMGCNITLKEIWKHLKKPWGVLIGAGCQFIVLPLLGFASAHAFSLRPEHAMGLIIISTCPGGSTSNLFTLWVNGDVSLSVTMTTISSLLAFGMMPLNIWLYSKSWAGQSAIVPYVNIVVTLASTILPVALGCLISWKSPKAGKIITKIGSILGLICIAVSIAMQFVMYPFLLETSWRLWVCCMQLPLAGFVCGYAIAFLLRQSTVFRRTVAFETGWQNVSTALAVIVLSYPKEISGIYSTIPIVYSIAMMLEGFIIVVSYRLVVKVMKKKDNTEQDKELGTGHADLSKGESGLGKTTGIYIVRVQ